MECVVYMGSISCNENSGYRCSEKEIGKFNNNEFHKLLRLKKFEFQVYFMYPTEPIELFQVFQQQLSKFHILSYMQVSWIHV